MKIVIFTHESNLSGANRSLIDYLQDNLNDKIHVVLARKNNEFEKKLQDLKVEYSIINQYFIVDQVKFNLKQKIKNVIKHILNILNYKSVKKTFTKLSKESFDVVLSNSFTTLMGYKFSRIIKKPHFWHIREFMEIDYGIKHPKRVKIADMCRNSHAIFISNSIKNYYLSKFDFLSHTVIFNKISFDKKYIKEKMFLDNPISILLVGSLHKGKGQLDAINAYKILKNKYDIKLTLCGDGPEFKNYKKYCVENNLDVTFTGYINNVLEIRKNSDIALVCSQNEALGRVTIEAMYYENFVIGTRGGETPYLIKDYGLTYQYGRAEMLADCIDKVIKDREFFLGKIFKAKQYAIDNFSEPIYPKLRKHIINTLHFED